MARSCVESFATLHAHGLTPALLERFASFVAHGDSGSFVFHVAPGGRIIAYEEHHKGRTGQLVLSKDLERMLEQQQDGHHDT
jgi:hypothetical protein